MTVNMFLQENKMMIYHEVTLVATDGKKITIAELLEKYGKFIPVKKAMTLDSILSLGAEYFQLSETVLKGKWSNWDIVTPRRMIMLCMVKNGFNQKIIGKYFSKNRTNVNIAAKKISDLIKDNKLQQEKYDNMLLYISKGLNQEQ